MQKRDTVLARQGKDIQPFLPQESLCRMPCSIVGRAIRIAIDSQQLLMLAVVGWHANSTVMPPL
jgi:hypothetical protein